MLYSYLFCWGLGWEWFQGGFGIGVVGVYILHFMVVFVIWVFRRILHIGGLLVCEYLLLDS